MADSRATPDTLATAGLVAVAADAALYSFVPAPSSSWMLLQYALRGVAAALIVGWLIATGRASRSDFGLTFESMGPDLRLIFRMGLAVLGIYLVLVAAVVVALRNGWIDLVLSDFRDVESLAEAGIGFLCAPVVEELVYRALAIPALIAGFGRRGALWVSGPLFYLLHIAYGKDWAMIHYFFAGWILAWAYLRTGRLWVVVVLHALGNLLMSFEDFAAMLAPDLLRSLTGQSLT